MFQSQITALQDEMEEKGQEMDKMRQELKDKEVESRIAGKKGDQLVRICLFDCFAFRFGSCAFVILSLLLTNFSIYNRNVHRKIVAMLCKGGRDITGWGGMEREVVRLLLKLSPLVSIFQLQVKDLKRQLKLERKRAEQLQQKLQEALTENKVKPGAPIILLCLILFHFFCANI